LTNSSAASKQASKQNYRSQVISPFLFILTLFFMISPFFSFGQSNCDTPSFTDDGDPECFSDTIPIECRLGLPGLPTWPDCDETNNDLIVVKTYVHIVTDDDFTGGQPLSVVNQSLNILVQSYASTGIVFSFEKIDYINDGTFFSYEDGVWFGLLLSQKSNSDGLDIYFLPPGVYDNGRGNPPYKNINGCVIGGGIADNGVSIPLTTFIAHEVGHCFGLLHTHETACNASGCNFDPFSCFCNDFVSDTNFDNQTACIDEEDCELCPGQTFPFNLPPPFDNIMSYYPWQCKVNFTEGQKNRMKRYLTECPNLNRVVTNDPLKILSDLEINYSLDVPGCLPGFIVETGGKLNISGNLNFEENASILVKTGGKLTIAAAHLAGCDDGYWKGITVQGKPSLNQIPTSNQGFAELKNYAIIEKAEQPLSVGGGGIVFSRQVDYYNCGVSTFYPYTKSNLSFFNSSNFILDSGFGLNTLYGQLLLYGVRNLKISGCEFSATALPNPNGNQNFAIAGLSSQFQVTNNTLIKGFYTGIASGDYGGNPLASLKAENCKFNGNFIGIDNWYGHGAIIRNNQFTGIGSHPFQPGNTSPSPHPTGLILRDCTGFIATDNVFEGASGGDPSTIGLLAYNTGSDNNLLRRNSFQELNVANQAELSNRHPIDEFLGLQYWCNTNTGHNNFDFLVWDQGIAGVQGENGNATKNVFSHPNTGNPNTTYEDFNNQSTNPSPIKYYHLNSTSEIPQDGYYFNIDPEIATETVVCPDENDDDKRLTTGEEQQLVQDFNNARTSNQNQRATYNALPSGSSLAPELEKQIAGSIGTMHRIAERIIRSELADTNDLNLPKIRFWLANKESQEAEYTIVETYLWEGDTLRTRQVRDSIPIKYLLTDAQAATHDSYTQWTELKIEFFRDGRDILTLDTPSLLRIQNIAEIDSGFVGTQAKSLLNLAYKYDYRLNPKVPGSSSEGLMAPPSAGTINVQQVDFEDLKAIPNPASDEVTFYYSLPEEVFTATLFVMDVNAREVAKFEVQDKEGSFRWLTDHLSSGIYLYTIRFAGNKFSPKKLVLIK
jgi:hypothetical protein